MGCRKGGAWHAPCTRGNRIRPIAKEKSHANQEEETRDARDKDEMVIGMAWFRREEWSRFLEVSADRDQLEETYDEWLQSAPQALLDFAAEGQRLEKVDVGVDELLKWCRTLHLRAGHHRAALPGPLRLASLGPTMTPVGPGVHALADATS
ncbi:MAG: hypothetical protein ACYSWU_19720 [Planctomycetota bacterium]|jgi:hypothetical protein